MTRGGGPKQPVMSAKTDWELDEELMSLTVTLTWVLNPKLVRICDAYETVKSTGLFHEWSLLLYILTGN